MINNIKYSVNTIHNTLYVLYVQLSMNFIISTEMVATVATVATQKLKQLKINTMQNARIGRQVATSYELQIQSECFQWAWNNYPEARRCLFHVPNGGKRSKVEAAWLKASGVISGIPDLLFVWRGKLYAFEMKNEKGVVSDAQRAVHKAWEAQGIQVLVVRSFDEFKGAFVSIISPRSEYGSCFGVATL